MNTLNKVSISAVTLAISTLSFSIRAEDPYQAFIDQANANSACNYIHQVTIHPRCQKCHGVFDKDGSFYPRRTTPPSSDEYYHRQQRCTV